MFRSSKHARVNALHSSRQLLESSFESREIQRGSVVVMECIPVVRNLSSSDAERRLPLPEDYTLKSLLDAGLPLREVSLLNQVSNNQLNDIFSQLDSTFVEPSKTE